MFTNYKGGKESNFIVEKSGRQHVNQVINVNFSRNGTNRSPALSGRIQSEAHSIPESNCNETADKVVHPWVRGMEGQDGRQRDQYTLAGRDQSFSW